MKKVARAFCVVVILLLQVFAGFSQNKGAIFLPKAKFITGDDKSWSDPSFNDQSWKEIETGRVWQNQSYANYHGYAWYRIHVRIPSSLKENALWKDSLRIFLAHVNDVDDTYLNGVKIGHIGGFPDEPGGYVSKWPAIRDYHISVSNPAIRWDQDNVIAIRVYDGGGTGGIFMGNPYIDMVEKMDGISVSLSNETLQYNTNGSVRATVIIENKFNTTVPGSMKYVITDAAQKKKISEKNLSIRLKPFEKYQLKIELPGREGIQFAYSYVSEESTRELKQDIVVPYLLTPAVSQKPRINTPAVTAVKPGSPFVYLIPVSGIRPIRYTVKNLPAGLTLDAKTGIITGTVKNAGDYRVLINASNSAGSAEKSFTIKVGNTLALTPPMGWNSWNCWGLSVSDEKVRSSAQAMIDKGLVNHGWSYINIDDGWEAPQRTSDGRITANEKFPDMKKLGDWLHGNGLRFGIYSSPGEKTCGGYLGSLGHELQDAETYASWGVDYLKYDWCSYSDVVKNQDTSTANYIKPYKVMQEALAKQNRDIYYSLCQYGMKNVSSWGPSVNAQSWRTTGDIEDTWQSLSRIGFSQAPLYKYAKPGSWNDPDMMIVGMVGWGENLHATRLTPYEQYTHVSLWSLLSAPLLIGCDLSKLDQFTLNLLTNDAVIAINQDELGKQAQQLIKNDTYQVWVKELVDGSKAIGIFNMSTNYQDITVKWSDIGLTNTQLVTDVWRQTSMGEMATIFGSRIPPHGVRLIQVKGNN
jgi:alpha-galactosidase